MFVQLTNSDVTFLKDPIQLDSNFLELQFSDLPLLKFDFHCFLKYPDIFLLFLPFNLINSELKKIN